MLVRAASLKVACVVVALMAICSMASADFIVGPGNVASVDRDSGNPLSVIDTSTPVTLSAGQYKATEFSCELGAGSGLSDPPYTGTIQPFLATSNGDGRYTIVAVGDAVAYNGSAQLWQSYAFGGTDTFAGDTLYAGYYWQSPTVRINCPIGYAASGSAGVWTDASALAPVKGTTTSVAQYPSLGRAYDFSITVASVPEPCSLAMIIGLGLGLLAYAWRKRRK